MSRSEIQSDPDAFLSDLGGPWSEDATGGSTGTPMVFRVDRETQIARESSLMWADSLAGWRPGERMAMLWGSDRDVKNAGRSWRLALRWWIENRRWYNAFEMGETQMASYHEEMQSFRPHLLVAYASAAGTLACFVRDRGLQPRYPLKAIVTSAEVLAADVRQTVEGVFGKPVFDRYGNREFGAIATECEAHDGLHVNESDLIVEIDSSDPVHKPGPVLITYLHNLAMPFIRYNTEDLGLLGPEEVCACGRRTRCLKQIVGRCSDMIRTSNGTMVHGEYFTHLFYGERHVRQFQFVQQRPDDYVLYLVAERGAVADREPEWRQRILKTVGREAKLRIDYVDRIPTSASGKHRFTLSHFTP